MKFLFFSILLSLGCSAADDKGSDTGTSDMGMRADLEPADTSSDAKMGLDIPDCIPKGSSTVVKTAILNGQNTEKELSFTMALCRFEQGIGESSIYRIDYFSVTWKGQTYDIETENLTYGNSHHNWFDTLDARSDAADFDWTAKYENEFTPAFIHTLSGKVGTDVLEDTVMDVECENCGYFQFVLEE